MVQTMQSQYGWILTEGKRNIKYRKARDGNNDEKHMMSDSIECYKRIVIHLYSNKGDETVFSPFGGIGSEGLKAIRDE